MPNEAITAAVKSVLGEYAGPEKIRALDAALRPIYGREAASKATALSETHRHAQSLYHPNHQLADQERHAACALEQCARNIRTAFGVTDND